jgi:hypothetical protein
VEDLIKKYNGDWEEVIRAAMRTDEEINKLLGIL